MKLFKSRIFQFTLVLALLGGIAGTILYISQKEEQAIESAAQAVTLDGIVNFDYARDRDFINAVFADDENWYWLVEGDRSVFSPEEMMQTMSSSRDPKSQKNLVIKVLYEKGKPIGFLAYYLKNFYMGKIRFVYVDKEHRGGGHGLKLVNYAVEDLKKLGASRITLITRDNNYAAQKIYQKAGFELLKSPEGFAYFAKTLE